MESHLCFRRKLLSISRERQSVLFICFPALIAINNEIQVSDSYEAVILKLNIFESLQRILYVRLNAEPGLIMMKCALRKLHIDSRNIGGYSQGMKSFPGAGKTAQCRTGIFSSLDLPAPLPLLPLRCHTLQSAGISALMNKTGGFFQAIWMMSDINNTGLGACKMSLLDGVQMAAP